MKELISACILFFLWTVLKAQTVSEHLTGKVSFISSRNVYVKFKSTEGISIGDTLFISSGDKLVPALQVMNLSSLSCVCVTVSGMSIPVDHLVIARKKSIARRGDTVTEKRPEEPAVQVPPKDSLPGKTVMPGRRQNIRGSFSVNSYSDFSNTVADNSQRFRYTFSLDAGNIANSKLSAETYVSFRHKAGEWQEVTDNIFNALKIYSLALRYDISESVNISLGRKINPKISNIGAMDGLQAEASLKNFSFGAVTGFRPDYADYGFNTGLFQYGGYVSFDTRHEKKYTGSSLAFMQQMNGSKTDRRFLYFQHSNALVNNVYLFSTFEVDLYKLVNDKPQGTFDLTGLYLLLRYRITKNLNISGSYDARKNVIYYETYKTYTDRILESEMRQGFRLQASYRITRDLMLGVSSGYRYVKTDPHASKNINGYLTYSSIPALKISATVTGTWLESNYMNGYIIGTNLSKDFFAGKLQAGAGYRYVDYTLPENVLKIVQHMGEANISIQLLRNLSAAFYYEGTFEKSDKYNRIYAQIRIRF